MRALGLVTASNTLLNVATATAITNVVLKAVFGAVRAFLLVDLHGKRGAGTGEEYAARQHMNNHNASTNAKGQ